MRVNKVLTALPVSGKADKEGRQRIFRLTPAQIRKFLTELNQNGRSKETVTRYRTEANRFIAFLGEEQWVYADSMAQWRQYLIDQGYMPRTINASIVAINSLLHYLGYRQLQYFDWLPVEDSQPDSQPADTLSREEYMQLLCEARRQGNMQAYLIIKVLACTALGVTELPKLTRECVDKGVIAGTAVNGRSDVTLPEALRAELQEYAIWRDIRSGAIFLGTNGRPIHRTLLYRILNAIAEDAGIPSGKATAMGLRKLYQQTMAEFQERANGWIRQSYETLLRQEETACGWLMRPAREEIMLTKDA